MLKKLAHIAAALGLLAATSFGGNCAGSNCANRCPLANQAVTCISDGSECILCSEEAREEFCNEVIKNLQNI